MYYNKVEKEHKNKKIDNNNKISVKQYLYRIYTDKAEKDIQKHKNGEMAQKPKLP